MINNSKVGIRNSLHITTSEYQLKKLKLPFRFNINVPEILFNPLISLYNQLLGLNLLIDFVPDWFHRRVCCKQKNFLSGSIPGKALQFH